MGIESHDKDHPYHLDCFHCALEAFITKWVEYDPANRDCSGRIAEALLDAVCVVIASAPSAQTADFVSACAKKLMHDGQQLINGTHRAQYDDDHDEDPEDPQGSPPPPNAPSSTEKH